MKVLLVDDEDTLRMSLADDLREAGYDVLDFPAAPPALEYLRTEGGVGAIITDWKMPEMDGMSFLRQARQADPDVLVIVITAYGTVHTAVEAVKQGAYDYLLKPFDTDELLLTLERALRYRATIEDNRRLSARLEERTRFHRLLGTSPAMVRVFEQLAVVASTNSTVLIVGETGTGKELVAEAIHHASPRKDKPLVRVSCAALSKEILESELFGHEKGAFTGAIRDKVGRFEKAQGGTIYLDDVDDIPMDIQVKLLRVLQERTMERVGSTTPIPLDVRVIASTKVDLRKRAAEGRFREDLFYRLNVVPIHVPPLRERTEDIPLLAQHFLKKYGGARNLRLTPAALEALISYPWPGNVRELEHLMERLSLTSRRDLIDSTDLPEEILCPPDTDRFSEIGKKSLDEIIDELTRRVIRAALARTGGNKTKAAELLKTPPSTLRSRMEKLGLS